MKLRKIEQKVLGQLDVNSRMAFSKIAKKLKTSEQRISYTVASLHKKEIIKGFYSLIDYSRLGQFNFRVFFRVSYVDDEGLQKLINYLIAEPHTAWVATLGGQYDLICTFMAPNPSYFNKLLRSIMNKFPKQLQNYSILTTIVMRYFGREVFAGASDELFIGGDRAPYDLDKLDLKLLAYLAHDARMSSVELGKELGVTPKTVISHIKDLEQRKVIYGFKPFLDLSGVGFSKRLLLVKYHNVSVKEESRLISFLANNKSVLSVVKLLGEWDLQIEIEVADAQLFRQVELDIRKRFAILIKEIDTQLVYQEHKKTFFPLFLIEK